MTRYFAIVYMHIVEHGRPIYEEIDYHLSKAANLSSSPCTEIISLRSGFRHVVFKMCSVRMEHGMAMGVV